MGCFSDSINTLVITDDMMARRYILFLDLFNHTVPEEHKLRNSIEEYGTALDFPYSSSMVITHRDILNNDIRYPKFANVLPLIIEDYLSSESIHVYCIMENTLTFRCLINHREEDLELQLTPQLRRLKSLYAQHTPYNFIIGVGCPQKNLSEFWQSYDESLCSVHYQLLMQTSGVYFYRNLLRFNPIEEDENTLLDELMQEFLRQNITGISLSIERYCRSLTILYAFFYGMLTLLSSVLTLEAFRIGPFSYTQVIICCNMIIPTLFGFVFWKEKLTRKQWVGIFFGITAVPLLCLAM